MKQFSDLFDEIQVYEVQRPHRAHLLLTLHLPLRSQKPLAATSFVQQVKCAKKQVYKCDMLSLHICYASYMMMCIK